MSDYARHSRWTEPGPFVDRLAALPAAPAQLPDIVSGLVLHPLFASGQPRTAEPGLRAIPEILSAILTRDPRPLDAAREPAGRVLGTCRTYALVACAILRQHGVPARLRVGFADYFIPGFWEDHWVCEVRGGDRWRLLDPELPAGVRGRFGIAFDPADVPRDRFLVAAEAWQSLRRGERDPARFGVSFLGLAGMGFAAGSLLRDVAALAKDETMPWDYWGPVRDIRPNSEVPREWLPRFDALAAATTPAPDNADAAAQIGAAFPWAALPPTILSFPEGRPVEVTLDRA